MNSNTYIIIVVPTAEVTYSYSLWRIVCIVIKKETEYYACSRRPRRCRGWGRGAVHGSGKGGKGHSKGDSRVKAAQKSSTTPTGESGTPHKNTHIIISYNKRPFRAPYLPTGSGVSCRRRRWNVRCGAADEKKFRANCEVTRQRKYAACVCACACGVAAGVTQTLAWRRQRRRRRCLWARASDVNKKTCATECIIRWPLRSRDGTHYVWFAGSRTARQK